MLNESGFFPEAAAFRDRWRQIRREADHIAGDIRKIPRFHEIMPEQTPISANDDKDWRMYILKAYGVEVPSHMQACPCLAGLLRQHPHVLSAAFSYMAPDKVVPTHRGPFRGITRYYLALDIPRDENGEALSYLTLDGRDIKLQSGEDLLWDDTYLHSVINKGKQVRSVLLLDVYRTGMPWDMRILSRLVITMTAFLIRAKRVFA